MALRVRLRITGFFSENGEPQKDFKQERCDEERQCERSNNYSSCCVDNRYEQRRSGTRNK